MLLRLASAVLVLSGLPALADSPKKMYAGKVLPFQIIAAIRNYGITKGGILPAQVAISVEGGTQADWLATAAYVAEKSIVNDVTFSTVEVYFPTPWGDKAPTRTKQLAKAYYSGPNPARSPWPEQQWDLLAIGHAPTIADVEFDALSNKLLEEQGPGADPDRAQTESDAKARRLIIKKYHLPTTWSFDEHLGAMDAGTVEASRDQVTISDSDDAEASIEALRDCLSRDEPGGLWRGCQDASKDYRFTP